MKNFLSKVKKYIFTVKSLKLASYIIANGRYRIDGSTFSEVKNSKKMTISFSIHSKKKNLQIIKNGRFFITNYKIVIISGSTVYTLVRDKERFLKIKSNIEKYAMVVPYKTMKCSFVQDYQLIISNIVSGNQFKDDLHISLFIDFYLSNLRTNIFQLKSICMGNESKDIIYFPQHGDCHFGNIFWSEKKQPTMIDLDDIDVYPLFYDLFYLIISIKHENAFRFFEEQYFKEKINCAVLKMGLNLNENVIDCYLAAYVYFWVYKMRKKMPYHEIYFYMRWFENADLTSFPLTNNALKLYKINLKKFKIKKYE